MTTTGLTRVDALVVSLFIVLSAVLVGLHVEGNTKLSPIDELQHIDYLYQIPDPPEPDDRVGQQALHQQLCRGVDAAGMETAKCQKGYLDPSVFQEKGYNTAAGYTPVYYTVTRVVAETIRVVTPIDNLVTAGRLVGALWLAAGLALIYLVGRLRGIGRGPLLVVTVLLVGSPAVLYPASTVAPDSAALASGGLLLLALTAWEQRPTRLRAVWLVLAGVAAAAVKMTYLVAVAAVSLYLLMRWIQERRDHQLPTVFTPVVAVAAGVSALASSLAWTAYVGSKPQIDPTDLPDMATRFAVPGFPWTGMGDSLLALVTPISNPWVVVGSPTLSGLSTVIISTMLVAGLLAAAVFAAAPTHEVTLARATLVAALVGAAGLVALSYITAGAYIPLPARYGAALVAPMAICTAACLRSRGSVLIMGGLAAVTILLALWRLTGLA